MSLQWGVLRTAVVIGAAALSWGQVEAQDEERKRRSQRRVVPIVGHWEQSTEDGGPVFLHDARKWNRDKTDGAFPVAIADDPGSFSEGTLRMRFKLIDGTSDRSAGLVFGYKPNGEYLFVRYNTREGNAALWQFANGERKAIAKGEQQEQLPLGVWHDIVVTIAGNRVVGTVNGRLRVEHTLAEAVSGRIGFWGKHDAVSAFTDLDAEPAGTAAGPIH